MAPGHLLIRGAGLFSACKKCHEHRGLSVRVVSRSCIVRVNKAEKLRRQVHELAESMGNLFVETFHYLALFAIGAVTAWAAVMEFLQMVEKGNISIDDILLLFIYLELGAMVGIYFKTKVNVTNILIRAGDSLASPMKPGAWCA